MLPKARSGSNLHVARGPLDFFWAGFAVLPWGVWRNREVLEVTPVDETLTEVTVVIPARNEAEVIQRTLLSVAAQGTDFNIILIDDDLMTAP